MSEQCKLIKDPPLDMAAFVAKLKARIEELERKLSVANRRLREIAGCEDGRVDEDTIDALIEMKLGYERITADLGLPQTADWQDVTEAVRRLVMKGKV